MSSVSLLEDLAEKIGCDCLSDLRLMQEKWLPRLKAELENIDEEEYSLSNWNEVILYITGSQSIDSMGINEASKAKDYMIQWLDEKLIQLSAKSNKNSSHFIFLQRNKTSKIKRLREGGLDGREENI